jgi:hypothetical protein
MAAAQIQTSLLFVVGAVIALFLRESEMSR